MSKKALIVVGLAAAVAAVSGAALTANNTAVHPRGADGDPTAVVSQYDNGDISDGDGYSAVDNIEETAASTEAASDVVSEEPSEITEVILDNDSDDQDVSDSDKKVTAEFKVIRLVDRNTGQEKSPRVLFGIYAGDCYLKMYSDCTAEICISPSNGQSRTGTYSIYGDTMYVDFGDEKMTEYKVVFSDSNEIEYIIVPSGGYDIYFG